MRNTLLLALSLGLSGVSLAAGCVSSVPVASVPCNEACSSSLDCVGSLICHNGTCAPSNCRSCGTAACTFDIQADGSCSYTGCGGI